MLLFHFPIEPIAQFTPLDGGFSAMTVGFTVCRQLIDSLIYLIVSRSNLAHTIILLVNSYISSYYSF